MGAWRVLRSPKPYSSPNAIDEESAWHFPGVSILKPLRGAEPNLFENLETFFKIDYPRFEIVFCIKDVDDPAVGVVTALIKNYPNVHIQMHLGSSHNLPNPKVDNLMQGYENARFDLLWISDSNVFVEPSVIHDLVPYIRDESVGMVTSSVSGHKAKGFAGKLEAFTLNTFYTRWIHIANFMGHPTVLGKAMMFRKSVLDRIGGLKALGSFLAEDYVAGKVIGLLGLKVSVSQTTAQQYIGRCTFKNHWKRHLRWSTIRKYQIPTVFYFEPWVSAIPSSLALFFSLKILGLNASSPTVAALALFFIIDFLIDLRQSRKINLIAPLLWPIRELLYLSQWLMVVMTETVEWRNQQIKVGSESLIELPTR